MESVAKPFSESYVVKTTLNHMRKSVAISIRKTFERIQEFEGNIEKSQEVFKTLSTLHSIQRSLDNFQIVPDVKSDNA